MSVFLPIQQGVDCSTPGGFTRVRRSSWVGGGDHEITPALSWTCMAFFPFDLTKSPFLSTSNEVSHRTKIHRGV